MSLPPMIPTSSAAGISSSSTGTRVVLGSRRPDGTYRKELKIRPGFTPEEDVTRYRASRAGMAPDLKGEIPGLRALQAREPRVGDRVLTERTVRTAAVGMGGKGREGGVRDSWDEGRKVVGAPGKGKEVLVEVPVVPEVLEKEPVGDDKRIKALRKKLRQTEMLREREAAGLYLPPAERAKIKGITELEDELAQLTLAMDSTTIKDDEVVTRAIP